MIDRHRSSLLRARSQSREHAPLLFSA
ncbi:hypothetical protein GXM19_02850 [Collinsella aerofaciens ATCC 25986]|uniref:Uncharacterized protein n=1 Tax=Collinsella aerofaciens (strain ATCC 25986 / DSM 3979 / JCM 10188 / KCTC 3647 / NCTC 11838 / VPI 1003) TaxID=411903 RepID=A0A858B6W9_COLAA|nr:hypothetical protein GXM19_02850 [Collinsella aerofaciens ATCC 25986]